MSWKNLFFVISSFFLIAGCELDELVVSDDPSLVIYFSRDTVLFDTVLTERSSITKRLRIYNPNDQAIELDAIELGLGAGSAYELVINGKSTHSTFGEVIFGKDSLLILVNVEIDPQDQNNPFLVKDSISVRWNGNSMNTKLIAWGQDAIYLGRGTICDAQFTAGKPYVFYDSVLVSSGCEMLVDPGTNLFFDKNAALLVAGKLTAIGDSANWITFRNSRFDENYLNAPGQWAGINFVVGSTENVFDYVIIENAISGITIGSPDEDTIPDIDIKHTIIRNLSQFGLLAFSSDIKGENMLVYNAGSGTIFNVAGGSYDYRYSTFVNKPNYFFQDGPSVVFSDFLEIDNQNVITEDLNLQLSNNIIWGSSQSELLVAESGNTNSIIAMNNNLIKSAEEIEANYTSVEENFPGFIDLENFIYQLDSASFCIDKGNVNLVDDLEGRPRDPLPDLGAFEYIKN